MMQWREECGNRSDAHARHLENTMTALQYRSKTLIEDLAVGECTVHRASGSSSARWWLLWWHALRDNDGQPELFCVPINPGGPYIDSGPGGRTWGLTCPEASSHVPNTGTKNWRISPSINVLGNRDAIGGMKNLPSVWHQTPEILNVPDDEPWANGVAP